MIKKNSLSVESWFSRGWQVYKERPKPLIGASVIFSAVSLGSAVVGLSNWGTIIQALSNLIVIPVLAVGWAFLFLRAIRGEEVKASDVFSAFSCFGRAWTTQMLFTLIILGGLFLLIVPGIIFSLMFGMCVYAVMDKKMSAVESVKYSKKITKGYRGLIFVLYVAIGLLTLLGIPFAYGLQKLDSNLIFIGLIPYLINVVFVLPWTAAAVAAAYDSLVKKNEEALEAREESV